MMKRKRRKLKMRKDKTGMKTNQKIKVATKATMMMIGLVMMRKKKKTRKMMNDHRDKYLIKDKIYDMIFKTTLYDIVFC